jgi:1,4-alpha-glucan branching enzyme
MENSVFAFLRKGREGDPPVLVVCNFTPMPRHGYRVGVPFAGTWREVLNTDARLYGGSDVGNGGSVTADAVERHGRGHSLDLTLPPLGTIMLTPEADA